MCSEMIEARDRFGLWKHAVASHIYSELQQLSLPLSSIFIDMIIVE